MGGLPAWEGGHPGRHAGWKPALLKEERDALHSIVICSRVPRAIKPPASPLTYSLVQKYTFSYTDREDRDEAMERYRRRRFLEEVNAAYMPLRQNAETWRAVEQERSEWDIALGDGLPKKEAGSGSEHNRRERKKRAQTAHPG